ncbi:MAG: isoprenyl transferase [Chlorobi bacterium]|nr:isoprenyl transferase [Chlorobiota bacterium]MBX7217647.1 isoprenyl transferase [Candidatus Kapabacteria bacterium]
MSSWSTPQTESDLQIQQEFKASGMLPKHVAIIMDGNGRWAKEQRLPRVSGHRAGVDSVRDIVQACGQLDIPYLTLYAFSTENWKRPKSEVSVLMDLLMVYLRNELEDLHRNNVRLSAIGQLNALPKPVQKQLHSSMEQLAGNTGLNLTLALSYSGRWDIVRGVQTLALDVRRGKLSPEDITEDLFRTYLTTASLPDPDLLIRTSGEMRLSNFLLWEMAYAELHIASVFWPEFRRDHLYQALSDFLQRERRFGKTSEQLTDKEVPARSYVQKIIDLIKRP